MSKSGLLLLQIPLHPFNGLFSRTTLVSRYRKGKTSLDLNEARDGGVLACSGISWTICKQSAPCCRQITTSTPHHRIFYRPDALPDAQWTVSKHTMHTMVSKSQTWGKRREGLRWRWKISGLVQVRRDVQPRFLQFFQNQTLWLFTDVPWPSNSLTYSSFFWPAGIKSHISTWDTHLYTGSKHHTWIKLSTRVKNTGKMKLCYNIIQHFILFSRAHTCKIQ